MSTNNSISRRQLALAAFHSSVLSIRDVGDFKPEEEDPNVLIYGPWLERGGSAFWVSTSGTGKSIAAVQLAYSMAAGMEFCGLRPRGRLKFWIFQSEDSPRRIAQDRLDVRAELSESHRDVDWDEVEESVRMVSLTGNVGVAFLAELDRLLSFAEENGEKPDVIVLNPLLAFVGGPITDGAYVTPFLRGGLIERRATCGLQSILERHAVAVLVFHHTPKPPTEKELDGWMKSAFPEYQGAGSSDITNWGRSFVTMMKVKGHPNMVCVTAGKNGQELGWEVVGGAHRRYMAYSLETGVSGKGRHAWRDLTPEEYAEVVGSAREDDAQKLEDAIAAVVAAIKAAPVAPLASQRGIVPLISSANIGRAVLRPAIASVIREADKHRLTVSQVLHARNNNWERHIGLAESIAAAKREQELLRKYEKAMKEGENATNTPNVAPVEAFVAPADAQPPEEKPQEDDYDIDIPF